MRFATYASTLIAVFVVLAGCGRTATDRRPEDSFICESCEEPEEPENPEEPEQPEEPKEPEEPEEPKEPEEPAPACSPKPRVLEGTGAPEIPERVDTHKCPLQRTEVDENGDGTPEVVTRWSSGDGSLIKSKRGQHGAFERILWVGATAGNVIHVEKRRRLEHSERVHVDTWSFDDRGRLVEKTEKVLPEKDAEESRSKRTVEQTFENGRLASRTETRREGPNAETNQKTWSYRYADGRLDEITYETPDATWTSEWTYDDRGRPVEVRTTRDGERAYTQSWSFRENGRLDSRRLVFDLAGEWSATGQLPQFDTMTPVYGLDRPGRQSRGPTGAVVFDDREDCRRLPFASGHGYPKSEQVYRIAWREGEIPRNGDYAYGYPGFGIYRGHAWYGHTGIFTSWPPVRAEERRSSGRVEIVVDYDARERMIREEIRVASEKDGQPAFTFRRKRSFGDGDLLEDRLTKSRGELSRTHTLRFQYEDDRLSRRTLLFEGETVERQSWETRGDRDVALTLASLGESPLQRERRVMDVDAPFETGDTKVHVSTGYHREFDDRGRLTRSWRAPKGSAPFEETRIEYSEHGPVEKTETRHGSTDRTTFSYDSDGRLLAKKLDYDDDGRPDHTIRHRYDDRGRRLETVARSGEKSRVIRRTTHQFRCH